MSSSSKETRSEATTRVTCAVAAWLWRRGCRIMALEVGLHNRLLMPWGSRWRVDLAAVHKPYTHVIEVKGTRADLVREDLATGKWIHPHPGLCLWLAMSRGMELHQELSTNWGLLSVDGHRVRVVREPDPMPVDEQQLQSIDAIARCLCMQSLPTIMMGKTHAQQLAGLETGGFDRPWRAWTRIETRIWTEESGNIL